MTNKEFIAIREEFEFSQQEMADHIYRSLSSVKGYECGDRKVPDDIAQSLKEELRELRRQKAIAATEQVAKTVIPDQSNQHPKQKWLSRLFSAMLYLE